MNYDDKPWLKSYDEWVRPEIEIPDISYVELLEKSLGDFPGRPAFRFLGTTQTFGELDRHSKSFARFVSDAGCGKEDVVGINLPNIPQYMIALTGALRAGCTCTGVSPLLSPKEMAYQINDAGLRVLVVLDAIFEQRLLKIADKIPNLTHIVVANIVDFLPWPKRFIAKLLKKVPTGKLSPVPGKTVLPFQELLEKYPPKSPKVEIDPEQVCLIQYTGGTTGLPKGAELSHRNVVANILQVEEWLAMERGKEVFCFGFPFFHQAGLIISMISMSNGGTQILIPDPRNTDHICSEIRKYKPTGLGNVPSLYQMLLENPAFKTLDFSECRFCGSGAAPFAVDSIRALEAVAGEGKVIEIYGMTEFSPFLTMNPRDKAKKIGSVGLPISNSMIKLVDIETGAKEIPIGEEGEIIARGPQMMKGYHEKPGETEHTVREFEGERWLYTGDVGRMDEDGFLYIVDRTKDMLNVGGYKVFSREAEETLYEHPAIEFCAIIGKPNPDRPGSDLVKAVIQPTAEAGRRDHEELKKDIIAYCRENMAPYKVPKIVEFVEEIPLTSVGKVDKKALR